jgi:hypothetical protein
MVNKLNKKDNDLDEEEEIEKILKYNYTIQNFQMGIDVNSIENILERNRDLPRFIFFNFDFFDLKFFFSNEKKRKY